MVGEPPTCLTSGNIGLLIGRNEKRNGKGSTLPACHSCREPQDDRCQSTLSFVKHGPNASYPSRRRHSDTCQYSPAHLSRHEQGSPTGDCSAWVHRTMPGAELGSQAVAPKSPLLLIHLVLVFMTEVTTVLPPTSLIFPYLFLNFI